MPGPDWKVLCAAAFTCLAGCEDPPYPVLGEDRAAPAPAAESASAAAPEPAPIGERAAEEILGAPPDSLAPEDFYRQRVTGRWSETPDCGGMSWSFQAESFTTPGEVHCTAVAVSAGQGRAVRVAGSGCMAEGAAQPDMTLEVLVIADTIDVTGVDNAVSTPGWIRCE